MNTKLVLTNSMNKFLIRITTKFLQYLLRKRTKKIHDSIKVKFPPTNGKVFISQSEDREFNNELRIMAQERELENRLEK